MHLIVGQKILQRLQLLFLSNLSFTIKDKINSVNTLQSTLHVLTLLSVHRPTSVLTTSFTTNVLIVQSTLGYSITQNFFLQVLINWTWDTYIICNICIGHILSLFVARGIFLKVVKLFCKFLFLTKYWNTCPSGICIWASSWQILHMSHVLNKNNVLSLQFCLQTF